MLHGMSTTNYTVKHNFSKKIRNTAIWEFPEEIMRQTLGELKFFLLRFNSQRKQCSLSLENALDE